VSTDAAALSPIAQPPRAVSPTPPTSLPEATSPAPADALRLTAGDTALVVVAHPGDETLALGASLADLCTLGVQVVVLSLTVGDASPGEAGHPPGDLPDRRRNEVARAAEQLGAGSPLVLDFPHSRLVEFEGDVAHVLRAAIKLHAPDLVLAPWRGEPETDYRTTGRTAVRVAAEAGVRCLEFVMTGRHDWDSGVAPLRPDELVRVCPSPMGAAARTRALAEYTSRTGPLGSADEVVIRPPTC
jgi:LmbE family N-acetylglucosaminyl deacetylase